jgi:hypothetical protein
VDQARYGHWNAASAQSEDGSLKGLTAG